MFKKYVFGGNVLIDFTINKGGCMIYSKPVSHSYKVKTQNGLAKYPSKYYFSAPIQQEMLYKEYWNVL